MIKRKKPAYQPATQHELAVKVSYLGLLRALFGGKVVVTTFVSLPFRAGSPPQVENIVGVERVFPRIKAVFARPQRKQA